MLGVAAAAARYKEGYVTRFSMGSVNITWKEMERVKERMVNEALSGA